MCLPSSPRGTSIGTKAVLPLANGVMLLLEDGAKDLRGSEISASKICLAETPDEDEALDDDMSEDMSDESRAMPIGLDSSSMPASTCAERSTFSASSLAST